LSRTCTIMRAQFFLQFPRSNGSGDRFAQPSPEVTRQSRLNREPSRPGLADKNTVPLSPAGGLLGVWRGKDRGGGFAQLRVGRVRCYYPTNLSYISRLGLIARLSNDSATVIASSPGNVYLLLFHCWILWTIVACGLLGLVCGLTKPAGYARRATTDRDARERNEVR
jgi:hypothetical protein